MMSQWCSGNSYIFHPNSPARTGLHSLLHSFHCTAETCDSHFTMHHKKVRQCYRPSLPFLLTPCSVNPVASHIASPWTLMWKSLKSSADQLYVFCENWYRYRSEPPGHGVGKWSALCIYDPFHFWSTCTNLPFESTVLGLLVVGGVIWPEDGSR